MKRSFAASLALHTLLLAIMLGVSGGGGNGNGSGNSDTPGEEGTGPGFSEGPNGQIIEKSIDVMEITPEVQKMIDKQNKVAIEKVPEKKAPKPKEDCQYYYGGIGITYSHLGGAVENVYRGYPAYEYGIRSGDMVIGMDGDIRGEIGTPVRIRVIRGTQVYETTLIRQKICILLLEP